MTKSAHAKTSSSAEFDKEAERTAQEERAIQRKIDRSDKKKSGNEHQSGAMQAGARVYPVPPLPDQHLRKPGIEADLELKPMYDAPHYKGSEKLLNKVALITGGDSGIGRSVAVLLPARAPTSRWLISMNTRMRRKPSRRSSGKVAAAFCYPATSPIQNSARMRWSEQ